MTGPAISLEDRKLLDAFGSPKPHKSAYSSYSKMTGLKLNFLVTNRQEPSNAKTLNRHEPLWMVIQDEANQKLEDNLRVAISEEEKEDDLIESCPEEAATTGDFTSNKTEKRRKSSKLSRALAKESNLDERQQRAVGSGVAVAVPDDRLRACPRVGQSVGPGSGGRTGSRGGRGGKGAYRLRIGSWNIGSLTSMSIEFAKILQKRKINIAYVQETRSVGSRAKNVDGYKLYSRVRRSKNGVGILVDSHLRESVVEVKRVNDRLMTIKFVVGECTLNVVSAYTPQVGLDEEIKRRFWEGDFNGTIGSSASGYTEVHGSFGFGERNGGGTSLLDFDKAFDLVIANSSFPN
ncbi:uncharacterized protein [Nicotiana sylvestris]|uniref:uncharacterized protein n=1 Tax=Nicotiana sylvestris TaxID=4096 RepID=UPI00388C86AB